MTKNSKFKIHRGIPDGTRWDIMLKRSWWAEAHPTVCRGNYEGIGTKSSINNKKNLTDYSTDIPNSGSII